MGVTAGVSGTADLAAFRDVAIGGRIVSATRADFGVFAATGVVTAFADAAAFGDFATGREVATGAL